MASAMRMIFLKFTIYSEKVLINFPFIH